MEAVEQEYRQIRICRSAHGEKGDLEHDALMPSRHCRLFTHQSSGGQRSLMYLLTPHYPKNMSCLPRGVCVCLCTRTAGLSRWCKRV